MEAIRGLYKAKENQIRPYDGSSPRETRVALAMGHHHAEPARNRTARDALSVRGKFATKVGSIRSDITPHLDKVARLAEAGNFCLPFFPGWCVSKFPNKASFCLCSIFQGHVGLVELLPATATWAAQSASVTKARVQHAIRSFLAVNFPCVR